jgi:hypothetical protein
MQVGILALALIAVLTVKTTNLARAYDFEPAKPMDVKELDPSMLNDVYGAWEIRDKSGKKRCRFTLSKEPTIGGSQIDIAPGCDKTFPIMADISAWRLLEGWGIDLVDPMRKIRIRFTTPDERYIPFGDKKDIVGMDELLKVQDKPGAKKK